MAPRTRGAVKRGIDSSDIIERHNTDSEEENPKRKKTSLDSGTTVPQLAAPPTGGGINAQSSGSNLNMSDDEAMDVDYDIEEDEYPDSEDASSAPLKGRKRFLADLEEMKKLCVNGFSFHGYDLERVRASDDEGTVEFKVLTRDQHHVVSANLLVSDTSEYPDHHTFYAFSTDSDPPPYISQVIEDVASGKSRTIRKTLEDLLSSIQKASREDDDGETEDYEAYDEDYHDFDVSRLAQSTLQPRKLQRDFLEVVGAGYRPGIVRFGADDFSLSVSIPVITLANDIPARALMAWDRRLLSRTHNLTLLVSGLRGVYPPLKPDGGLSQNALARGTNLQFKVGLTRRYKPSKEHALEAKRTFGLVDDDVQARTPRETSAPAIDDEGFPIPEPQEEEEEEDDGRFDSFSLSSSLETLLDQSLVRVIQTRIRYNLGWAGAEALVAESERLQQKPDDILVVNREAINAADKTERKLASTYNLPPDPITGREIIDDLNLPLVAFCYLVRRLTLCTRYCLVCHNKLNTEFEVLKPYVCDSKLCSYQFYAFNRGSSLEYEIRTNPETVDLLVSIAYTAAADQVLEDPLPIGMGLRVPVPDPKRCVLVPTTTFASVMPGAVVPPVLTPIQAPPIPGPDGLCEFDEMGILEMRASIAELIQSLPPIKDIKRHLDKKSKAGQSKPKLKDMDPNILPAAWLILRWCIASCTAHLEELTSDDDLVRNIDSTWRQFRFTIGAPDAEAKFKAAVTKAQTTDNNARKYPSLYAFHGSALKNWHSIIRHGLWFKNVTHGRAYGHGVYFAKDGSTSMGSYAQSSPNVWRNSQIAPRCCVAVAEIVNQPTKFVSSNPHYVVADTTWIICRYLLVKTSDSVAIAEVEELKASPQSKIPLVKLDPAHPLTLTQNSSRSKRIEFPEPSYKLNKLLLERQSEYFEEDYDEEDQAIFEFQETPANSQQQRDVIVIQDSPSPPPQKAPVLNDWKHDPEWVTASIAHLMPPPLESSPSSTMAVQRELSAMIKEQDNAHSLKELGWYMPMDLIGDNLFQWIVELHSFEEALPVAKGMKAAGVNSIIFEIRFPSTFPLAPPFFRIIKPRLLPFIQGGGGHVTGGGSMCMDLLTSDGWLPSYSISAVLLQIKLAISNLEPRPAQLARDWDKPYGIQESLEGFKRAAATHGWKVPVGIDKLVR